jgi:3-oxoacyl-[acyl-carrier-protein] synthase-3
MRRVYLTHLTHYFPDTVLDNRFFERIMDTSDAWIRDRVGIAERRFMSDYRGSFPVFEIGRRAVEKLLATSPFELAEVDVLLSCSCNDDLQFPGPGNMLCEHFGLRVPTFHVKNGCSSVACGLEVARGLLQLGSYRNVLVVTGEPFTHFADYADRSSSILFGDASTALVVSTEPGPLELVELGLGGRGSRVIHATAPGAAVERSIHDVHPDALEPDYWGGVTPAWGRFQQAGRTVFDFVVNEIPGEIQAFARGLGLSIGDFDWFIAHQANLPMLEVLCEKLGVPPERHLYNIDRAGNTSSAGWVSVLSEALEDKRFAPGERILVSVFGAGLGWGNLVLHKT